MKRDILFAFLSPDYPRVYSQNYIVNTGTFNDLEYLQQVGEILSETSVIIDIGANIGNHTLYWATIQQAEKVYAFEPLFTTFEILEKNIKINNLKDIVKIYNAGVGEKSGKVSFFLLDTLDYKLYK